MDSEGQQGSHKKYIASSPTGEPGFFATPQGILKENGKSKHEWADVFPIEHEDFYQQSSMLLGCPWYLVN